MNTNPVPFEYLTFQIGYTIEELKNRFIWKATDYVGLEELDHFGQKPETYTVVKHLGALLSFLHVFKKQAKKTERLTAATKAEEACKKSIESVDNFFHNSTDESATSLDQSGPIETANSIVDAMASPHPQISEPTADDFGNGLAGETHIGEAVTPPLKVTNWLQASDLYRHWSEIVEDFPDYPLYEQLQEALSQHFTELSATLAGCFKTNDGREDPFFTLGKKLGELAWHSSCLHGDARRRYYSEKFMPNYLDTAEICRKIRPSLGQLLEICFNEVEFLESVNLFQLATTIANHLESQDSTNIKPLRHPYKNLQPKSEDDWFDAAKNGIEIYGLKLKLGPLHQRMVLMLLVKDGPVSVLEFAEIHEPWRTGRSPKEKTRDSNKLASQEISRLKKKLAKALGIKSRNIHLIKKTSGPGRESLYSLDWEKIDLFLNPSAEYLSRF